MAQRYQHVEHAILTLVLEYGDHQGYANTLGGLANILRGRRQNLLPDRRKGIIVAFSPDLLDLAEQHIELLAAVHLLRGG